MLSQNLSVMRRTGNWNAEDREEALQAVQAAGKPLESPADLEALCKEMSTARVVMLGEASHGTHEYYIWRTRISKKLMEEYGFSFVAVEGDWPDCYRLNRWIKGQEDAASARDVLQTFERWPTWMWANYEVSALAEWMKQHNKSRDAKARAGFYGLDVYSLWQSMEEIMEYLREVDPQALKTAEQAYRCFEPYAADEGYGYASALRFVPELCERAVVKLLSEIEHRMPLYSQEDPEAAFAAAQNARVAVDAERYYRAMLGGSSESWNERDRHMQETLEHLLDFHGPASKAIVWAHNTHVGDARYTDMDDAGMHNIGSLSRERLGEERVFLFGFGSYEGSVLAGPSWGANMEVMPVPKGRGGSWEALLNQSSNTPFWLPMKAVRDSVLGRKRIGHRAIGVVYDPNTEQWGNYVPSVVAHRYDGFLFLPQTKALHPVKGFTDSHKMPETYPFGM